MMTENQERIQERLRSAQTFKLTGLNNSQKSSITHEPSLGNTSLMNTIVDHDRISHRNSFDGEEVPDFKLDGKFIKRNF